MLRNDRVEYPGELGIDLICYPLDLCLLVDLRPPSKALINKRKLCKPVGTSEKEAEDKKKTKQDEEVATTTLVCTSSELVRTSFVKV